jgi:hypothetical protein
MDLQVGADEWRACALRYPQAGREMVFQDMRQAALPRSSRLENGSVYIRTLYNRNNTTDLSNQRLKS